MQNSHTGNYKYKVCILGYSYMFQLAHKVVSTLSPSNVEYIIMNADLESQDECIQEALALGCETFITGGGSAVRFSQNYNLPLVEFQISDIDYIKAIRLAKEQGYTKIGVAYYRYATPPNCTFYSQLLKVNLLPLTFESLSELKTLISNSDCDVFIGASGAIEAARELKRPEIPLYAGEETIRNACTQAAKLSKQVYEAKRNQTIFHMVLNTSQLGIIITDTSGNIEFINKTMQSYINITQHQALSLTVQELFPNISLPKFLKSGLQSTDRYHLINSVMMRCVFERIVINRLNIGVIMSFHPNPHNLRNNSKKNFYSISPVHNLDNITAYSPSMKNLVNTCKHLSPITNHTVIIGPPGSGREEIANCLHNASKRASNPCITIDLATIDDENAISVLLGYTQKNRTTTGLLVDGNNGSIILKNLNLTTPRTRSIILRALNSRQFFMPGMESPITFDIIFYTLLTDPEYDALYTDIRHLLSIMRIDVPGLHSRKEDIPYLFKKYISALTSKKTVTLTNAMEYLLQTYSWPGNVVELRAICAKYITIMKSVQHKTVQNRYHALLQSIGEKDIIDDVKRRYAPIMTKDFNNPGFKQGIEELKILLKYTYNDIGNLLEISRTTLWRALREKQKNTR